MACPLFHVSHPSLYPSASCLFSPVTGKRNNIEWGRHIEVNSLMSRKHPCGHHQGHRCCLTRALFHLIDCSPTHWALRCFLASGYNDQNYSGHWVKVFSWTYALPALRSILRSTVDSYIENMFNAEKLISYFVDDSIIWHPTASQKLHCPWSPLFCQIWAVLVGAEAGF